MDFHFIHFIIIYYSHYFYAQFIPYLASGISYRLDEEVPIVLWYLPCFLTKNGIPYSGNFLKSSGSFQWWWETCFCYLCAHGSYGYIASRSVQRADLMGNISKYNSMPITSNLTPQSYFSFLSIKYILLIMLLGLSNFFSPLSTLPWTPFFQYSTTAPHHLVHVHRLYI